LEIFFNSNPEFTKWMASSGALHEKFVVIDVGVLGGESPRWQFLGDHLVVHGFDAIKEVIDELSAKNAKIANKTYHWFAINEIEREFFFNPAIDDSSFYKGSVRGFNLDRSRCASSTPFSGRGSSPRPTS
jgi:hypothetical protein